MNSSLERILNLVNKISVEQLEELVRRDAVSAVPDGFPTSSGFDGGGTSRGWGPESTSSTVAAAMARQRPVSDELRKRLKKIEQNIHDAERSLNDLHKSLKYMFAKEDDERGRKEQSSPCAICLVAPAKKAGWCDEDRAQWEDAGRPDRLLWTMYLREDRNSEGILMVPECPPPTI